MIIIIDVELDVVVEHSFDEILLGFLDLYVLQLEFYRLDSLVILLQELFQSLESCGGWNHEYFGFGRRVVKFHSDFHIYQQKKGGGYWELNE